MKLEFKENTKKDLKSVLDLFNYYIENSTAVWLTGKINGKELKEIIPFNNKKYRSYRIIADNEFCGFCCFKQYNKRPGYDRTAELSIYLKPEFTNRGIGLKAIKFLEIQSKKAGIRVLVGSISSDNKASIKLFIKAGYKKCGHLKQVGEKFNRILGVIYFQKIFL